MLGMTVPDTGAGMLESNRLDAMVRVGRQAAEAGLRDPASAGHGQRFHPLHPP